MRAAIYARVSTEEQVEGHSMDYQQEDMKAAATRDGFDEILIYKDDGFSAKTTQRPGFLAMIADAKAGKYKRLYVWKWDRFARSRDETAVFRVLLKEQGVEIISLKEPSNPDSPADVLLQGVLETVAEWYSVDLKQKVSGSKQRRAELGL